MQEFLERVPCGFLSFGEDGTVTLANPALAKLLGRELDAIQGSNVERLLTVGARIFYYTHFFPLLKLNGVADEIFLTMRSQSGEEVPVLVNAVRRNVADQIAYDCAIFPVAQRGRFENELIQAKKSAEDATRARDDFLAVVSHELRTPLSAILGWAQIMRMTPGDKETTRQGLETIEQNVKAQTRLIEDLIDVSRIVSGKLRLEIMPVDLRSIVQAAIDVVQPAAEAKGIGIDLSIDPLSGIVSGDPDRLQQVLWNLLSNAVKFTPQHGSIQLRVHELSGQVEVSVTDTGQGIAPEFLPYVFERFRQAEGASSRRHCGLGLGMAITKDIVELHGGSIRAVSQGAGQGSSFIVSLPRTAAPTDEQASQSAIAARTLQAHAVADPPQLAGISVMLVNESTDARNILSTLISHAGAEVTAVASAAEAYKQLAGLPPCVMVTDIEMPEEDGLALMRRVRALPSAATRKTPAIALTANGHSQDRMAAFSAGFQACIAKPVDPNELLMVIANLGDSTARGRQSPVAVR